MKHKAGKRKAIKFFEDNYIMIHSLQSSEEQGCADKCLELLKKSDEDTTCTVQEKCKEENCPWYKEKPDMREKVKEYISELDAEIDRCHKLAEQNMRDESTTAAEMMMARVQTLIEVKNDLQGRLDELV